MLQSSSRLQALVLVENTRLSEQYFTAVQKFVVFDLGLTLLPVGGQTEAAQLIAQMVSSREEIRMFSFTQGASSESHKTLFPPRRKSLRFVSCTNVQHFLVFHKVLK